ncbi:glycosyltransferase family 4 protein [Candidatus Jorgensenbacteria bacterium]|nr:glycosyltransferase family 4 protein [Candidatus Jorgensenbacteria bacterium]
MKKNLGIVLPMGQNSERLKESGQWSLWESELVEYRKVFSSVELFEYRHCDWRRFFEALLLPIVERKRLHRCSVLKAVHLTGAVPCLVARLLYGIPYALSFGYRYDEFAAIERKWAGWVLSTLLTPMAIGFAKEVMVPTEALRGYVRSFGAKKIVVIPNGVDTEAFKGQALPRQGLALSETWRLTVLFVGRLEKQKNLMTLLQAVYDLKIFQKNRRGRVSKKGISAKLILVGDGSLKRELEGLSQRLNVDMELKNPVANDKLTEVYQRADIFVLPSLIEGHPKVLLEAMSCGLPCIASNIPGVKDIIVDGKNGLLVEPTRGGLANGLQRLIKSKDLRQRLGAGARKIVIDKFDKSRLMRKEILMLQKMVFIKG